MWIVDLQTANIGIRRKKDKKTKEWISPPQKKCNFAA